MNKISFSSVFNIIRNLSFCFVVLIIIFIPIYYFYLTYTDNRQEISYTQFLEQIDEQQVERVTIVDNEIYGNLKNGQRFYTIVPDASALISTMQENQIDIKFENQQNSQHNIMPPWFLDKLSDKINSDVLTGSGTKNQTKISPFHSYEK
ncbi:MAG: ftsH 5 [Firmicutes bacterium]|nr:ftsH 5 [Bacillota bacterium]